MARSMQLCVDEVRDSQAAIPDFSMSLLKPARSKARSNRSLTDQRQSACRLRPQLRIGPHANAGPV
jgi:hypothetical protein